MNTIFDKHNYIIINNVLSQEICQLLANYANFKASIKPNVKKDKLHNVHREYGDCIMDMLLQQFTPLIEQETGMALWPTLSFYYTYKNGHQLAKHKDRSSCQIVAGLCIGADKKFHENHGSWSLILNIDGKDEAINLDFGDLVIFKGSEIEHWRESFTGVWFVSAIFAYVDKNGPFAFQKFDQRKLLGLPHIGMFRWSYGYLKNMLKRKFVISNL